MLSLAKFLIMYAIKIIITKTSTYNAHGQF